MSKKPNVAVFITVVVNEVYYISNREESQLMYVNIGICYQYRTNLASVI